MNKTIITIDPGASGGVAIRNSNNEVSVYACPDSIREMADILQGSCFNNVNIHAYIEDVHSMPGQGVVSTFKFGKNLGRWEGMLAALKIPFERVAPTTWQKTWTLPKDKKAKKNKIKALMQEKHPHLKVTLKTADALGILSWALKGVSV